MKRRLKEYAKKQPEILNLRKLLLSVGGKQLVPPPGESNEIVHLIESGFVMEHPVTVRIMQSNRCHLNSVELFATGKATGLGTGYALSDDGLWRQHSWAFKRQKDGTNRIIETTSLRDRYFGLPYFGLLGKFAAIREYEFHGLALPASLAVLKRS